MIRKRLIALSAFVAAAGFAAPAQAEVIQLDQRLGAVDGTDQHLHHPRHQRPADVRQLRVQLAGVEQRLHGGEPPGLLQAHQPVHPLGADVPQGAAQRVAHTASAGQQLLRVLRGHRAGGSTRRASWSTGGRARSSRCCPRRARRSPACGCRPLRTSWPRAGRSASAARSSHADRRCRAHGAAPARPGAPRGMRPDRDGGTRRHGGSCRRRPGARLGLVHAGHARRDRRREQPADRAAPARLGAGRARGRRRLRHPDRDRALAL